MRSRCVSWCLRTSPENLNPGQACEIHLASAPEFLCARPPHIPGACLGKNTVPLYALPPRLTTQPPLRPPPNNIKQSTDPPRRWRRSDYSSGPYTDLDDGVARPHVDGHAALSWPKIKGDARGGGSKKLTSKLGRLARPDNKTVPPQRRPPVSSVDGARSTRTRSARPWPPAAPMAKAAPASSRSRSRAPRRSPRFAARTRRSRRVRAGPSSTTTRSAWRRLRPLLQRPSWFRNQGRQLREVLPGQRRRRPLTRRAARAHPSDLAVLDDEPPIPPRAPRSLVMRHRPAARRRSPAPRVRGPSRFLRSAAPAATTASSAAPWPPFRYEERRARGAKVQLPLRHRSMSAARINAANIDRCASPARLLACKS